MHFRHVEITDEVGDQSRRVPSGTRSQFTLFDKDRAGPTLVGEVVEQTHAHGPASNDDAARLLVHSFSPWFTVSSSLTASGVGCSGRTNCGWRY